MQFVEGSINSVPDIYLHLIIMRGVLLFYFCIKWQLSPCDWKEFCVLHMNCIYDIYAISVTFLF
jgi:hypothetical protein